MAINALTDDSIERLSRELYQLRRLVRSTHDKNTHGVITPPAVGGDKLYLFTTTEDMGATTANEAAATIRRLDGTQLMTGKVVKDPDARFSRQLSGAKGTAVKRGGTWYVVESEVEATMYYGLQVGALLTTDSTNAIDGLQAMNGQATASSSITAQNTFSWEADDNAPTIIAWNENSSDWDMIQVKCPA